MSESDIKVSVVGDSTNIDQTFAKVERGADKMAQSVSKSGEKAAKSTEGIGKGADNAARAYGRFEAEIRRKTAAVQAALEGTGKAGEIANKAIAQGLDASRLEPGLKKLRELEGALGTGGIAFDRYGMSAKQTAAAMRGVPAQMTDIIVSLQGGQRPMTVLLQQGGQMKDMFGGIVPAARALASGFLAMINPATLAAGAVGGIYAAYRAGAAESEAFNRTIVMTGSAAGVTVDQLNAMAGRIGSMVGTQRQAAAALNEFAGAGKIAASNFEAFASSAIGWEKATGSAISETVKQFNELGKSPVEASLKLNESMNFLTESTYKQIKALHDSGRETDAASLAQKTFADTIDQRTPQILQHVGSIERAWVSVKGAVSGAISAMMDIGRPETVETLNTQLQERLARLNALQNGPGFSTTGGGAATGGTRGGSRAAEGVVGQEAQKLAAEIQMLQQKMTEAAILIGRKKDLDQSIYRDSYAGDSSRQTQAQQRAAAVKAESDAFKKAVLGLAIDSKEYERVYDAHKTALTNIDKKYEEKKKASGGGISTTQTELAGLNARIEAEKQRAAQFEASAGALANLNDGEKLALQYAEKLKLATKASTIAELERNKALATQYGAIKRKNDAFEQESKLQQDTIAKVKDQTLALEDQIATYGLGRSAIESLIISRLESKKAAEIEAGSSQAVIDGINKEIAARKELGTALAGKERLDAEKKANEESRREFEKTVDDYDRVFREGFALMLNNGEDKWKSFTKSLRTTFTTTVADQLYKAFAQPFVVKVVASMMGITGAGAASANQLSGGSSGGMPSMFGGGNSTLASGINWMGEKFGSTALQSFSQGLAGTAATWGQSFALSALPATASWAGAAAGIGAAAPSLAGLQIGSGVAASMGTGVAGTVGAGTAAAAAAPGAAGFGAALGAAAPYIGIGLAAFSMLSGSFKGESRSGGVYHYDQGMTEAERRGWSSGDPGSEFNGAVSQVVMATANAINSAFAGVGSSASLAHLGLQLESSGKGRGGTSSGATLTGLAGGDVTIGRLFSKGSGYGDTSGSLEEMFANMQVEASQTIVQAWQAGISEFPKAIQDMISGINADSLSAEASQAVVAQVMATIEAVNQMRAAFDTLPFANLKSLSFDATTALIAFGGGVEAFTANLGTYYANFYSAEEQFAAKSQNMAAALSGIGVAMPDLTGTADQVKAAFRGIVDSIDVTTEAGQRQFATMIGLSGSFAELTGMMEQLNAATVAAAQAEAQRLEAIAQAVTQERLGLEGQLLQLQGDTVELRRRELAALDPSNRALQEHIWSIQDLETATQAATAARQAEIDALQAMRTAAESAAGSAMAALTASVNAEKSELQKAFSAIADVLNTSISASKTAISTLESMAGRLRSTLDSMRGRTDERQSREWAQAQISMARAAGVAPSGADFEQALSIVAQPSEGLFATFEDYQLDFLKTANDISALSGITDKQLTIEERTLKTLEEQLKAEKDNFDKQMAKYDDMLTLAQQQIDVAMGIDTKVLSNTEALLAIAAAIAGLKVTAPASYLSQNPDVAAAYANGSIQGKTAEQAAAEHYAQFGAQEGRGSAGMELNPALSYIANNPDVAAQFASYGQSQGLSLEEYAAFHYDKHGKNEGRSFAVGTNYVPYDMDNVSIHEGERIVPKADNRALMAALSNPQANNTVLAAAVDRLTKEVEGLRAEARATAQHTNRTAKAIERAMPDGDAIQVREAVPA